MNEYCRFLLRKRRWILDAYLSDPEKTLQESILDLSPTDNELSVYFAEDNESEDITDREVIAFLYSASTRGKPDHLYYIDLYSEEIKNIGIKIKNTPKHANLKLPFYADRHFDLYPMNDDNRTLLAKLIFNKIKLLNLKEPLKIERSRIKELIYLLKNDIRLKGLNSSKLQDWAKPN